MDLITSSEVWENPFVLIGAMIILSMVVVASVPRRWLGRAILAWFFLPLVGYFAYALLESVRSPREVGHNLQLAFYGLAIVSPGLALAWVIPSCIGIFLGLVLRWLAGLLKAPAVRSLMPSAQVPSVPGLDDALSWPMIHVGVLSDRLVIGGYEVRNFKWWPCSPKDLPFINPKSAHPLMCSVFEVGTPTGRVRFAAGEVSNGVWAFFSAAPHELVSADASLAPVGGWRLPDPDIFDPPPGGSPVHKISPDGSIRVDIQSEEWSNTHWVNAPRVTDIGNDKVVLDLWGSDCHAVTSFPRERCVVLSVQRYRGRQTFVLTIDVERRVYDLAAGPGLSVPSQTGELDDLAELAGRIVTWEPAGAVPRGPVRVAWRSGLLILLAACLAIWALSYFSPMSELETHIVITTMPKLNLAP